MTDFIRARATPEQISHYFCGRGVKKPKSTKRPARMIEQCVRMGGVLDNPRTIELQLPIMTMAEQAGGHWRSGGVVYTRQKQAATQINTVVCMLQAHLRSLDRAAISGIVLTRLSPGRLDAHDNLRQAFKHVLDAVCAWIVRGDDFNDKDRRVIGKFDDQLIGTGKITCDYEQTTNETDPKAHGIRIRLRLGSQPTLTSEP